MSLRKKIGILGAGQLGKMLAIEGANWHLHLEALDSSPDSPAAHLVQNMKIGQFGNFDDVVKFGIDKDILTIEIEHVNTEALRVLKAQGKTVIPDPDLLDIIKDKGRQKEFYKSNNLPTSSFELYKDKKEVLEAVDAGDWLPPFVQKSRTAGYDGKGVVIIKSKDDLNKLLDGPCVIEKAVDIDKELAVIAVANALGELKIFPVVEMLFNPEANLVENLFCPARIDDSVRQQAEVLARSTMTAYGLKGLLAIEMFLSKDGELLINEVAPRPHNSGHHTIEACVSSQYQQHLRALLNLPLGDTSLRSPAMMINLLGHPDHEGPAMYSGIEEIMKIPNVYVHIYGKQLTKPYRKMGHITILGDSFEAVNAKANQIRQTLKVISS